MISIRRLGALRVEVLRRIAGLTADGTRPTEALIEGVLELTAETVRTVGALASQQPRPTILWNEELDAGRFLGRTLLLADHVLCPDRLFAEVLREPTRESLRELAQAELENEELYLCGAVIPVPPSVAMAVAGEVAQERTARDLADECLVAWVRSQLVLEGPTAREAIFVEAKDDLQQGPPQMWLHAHLSAEGIDPETGRFETQMLRPYDADYDYGPWIRQVTDEAVSAYVQRTNQRLIAADIFGAEYISASLFEARLLRLKGSEGRKRPAQAALWADVPELPNLHGKDLARLLRYEEAIQDLRARVRASLATARSDADNIDAITALAHDLQGASRSLLKKSSSDRMWRSLVPGGLGVASVVIGGLTGGLLPAAVGVLGAIAGLSPNIGDRLNARRDAAYLFVAAQRRRRSP